jgi:MoxR-like ATPase
MTANAPGQTIPRSELETIENLRREIAKVIVGQTYLIDQLLLALLSNSHVLLEGVPGLGKTLSITTLAQAVQLSFRRIQFTPDLLPADVIGTLVFDQKSGEFQTHRGPIFANLILADEINRAPAKVQSALLEAMQERQVTIGGQTYPMEEPFLVLATQNPIEQEGTYPLPEAQVDRFMLKLRLDYPDRTEELGILRRMARAKPVFDIHATACAADILRLRGLTDEIFMDERVEEYIVTLVDASRNPARYRLPLEPLIRYGASPRATIYLAMAGKAHALLAGRGYVLPEDIKAIAPDVLRHRLIPTYEAEALGRTSEDLLAELLKGVAVP